MIKETVYSLTHGKIAALELGEWIDQGLSVVFVHGWLDNAASFYTLMMALHDMAPNVHMLALDLPGHGKSDHKSADNYYPFHDYIADLHQVLDELSPNRLLLVGHSLGALIASCYSAAFPERIDALIEIEGAGPLAESAEKSVQRLRTGILSRGRQNKRSERTMAFFEQALQKRMQVNSLTKAQLLPIVTRGTQC